MWSCRLSNGTRPARACWFVIFTLSCVARELFLSCSLVFRAQHRYIEAELHLDLWHYEAVAGCLLLIIGSICSYCIVGPRTGVDVVMGNSTSQPACRRL